MGIERIKGETGAIATSSSRLFQSAMMFGKNEHCLVNPAVWHWVGKWIGFVRSTDCGLMCWFVFTVTGNHSMAGFIIVGESGASVSGLLN